MYCPQCNYPVPAKTETCPNCSHIFLKPKQVSADSPETESKQENKIPDTAQREATADLSAKPLNKKVLWGIVFVLAPFTAIVLSVLSSAAGGVPQAQGLLSIIAAFLMFLSLVLVPAALIMGFLGYREIKKSPDKSSGKGLSIAVIIFSILILISGPIYGYYIFRNLDSIKEQVVDRTIEQIESGLREKEIQNRNAEKVNSLGSYFPEKLDNAPPESKSSSDNPFFTEV
ncbi:MAG: hypothetical protein GY863_05620, partial [bacterium]|nr:hypothetical protein [bacterium]